MRFLPVLIAPGMVLALLPAADPIPVPAGQAQPRGYVAVKADTSPKIDGILDDKLWKAAAWSDDFEDIEGGAKPKPAHRTRMKIGWDTTTLYIAAELTEPHVWATLTEHDSVIFQDPDFEVFLDPDSNNHDYAELELNAKNTTWDLLLTKPYKDGGRAINGWEIAGLKTAVHVQGTLNDSTDTDTAWTVEIAWPLASLKELGAQVPPQDGDRWRINFSRVQWDFNIVGGKYVKQKKPEHNWVWSPQGVIDMHRPERWGYLQFSTKTAGPVAFTPDPLHEERMRLHEFYYAQRTHYQKHGRYANGLKQLGLGESRVGNPTFEVSSFGYEARLPTKTGRLVIGPDSLIRHEEKKK